MNFYMKGEEPTTGTPVEETSDEETPDTGDAETETPKVPAE